MHTKTGGAKGGKEGGRGEPKRVVCLLDNKQLIWSCGFAVCLIGQEKNSCMAETPSMHSDLF